MGTRVSSHSLSIDDVMVRAYVTCVMVSVCLPSHDGLSVTFKSFGIEGLGKYVCGLQ